MNIPADFLEEYGLFRKCITADWTMTSVETIDCPPIQMYCDECEQVRTWLERGKDRRCIPPASTREDVSHRTVALNYVCGGCTPDMGRGTPLSIVFLVYFGATDVEYEIVDEKRKFAQAAEAWAKSGYVMKVGQHPRPDVSIPPELRRRLGNYSGLFKQGRISEFHGFGIGSFAYYRRIVEDTIDRLLGDIRDQFVPQANRQDYDNALAHVAGRKDASAKIDVVKHLIPEEGGRNSLKLLHDALSVGLHALSDAECLDLAAGIRALFINLHDLSEAKRKSGTSVVDASKKIEAALNKHEAKKNGASVQQ